MNIRLALSFLLVLLLSTIASGQQVAPGDASPRQALLHQIAVSEADVRQAESAHADNVALARNYAQIGLWYEDAGLWNKSEADLEHAVSLLRHASGSNNDLAAALANLGSLHVAMGKLGESENEEHEALKLRENIGDRLLIARSWEDLAALSLAQHKYAKARDFAQQATTELLADGRATAFDRLSARYTLSMALCYLKDCVSALPMLKGAVAEAKAIMQPSDLPVGFGDFLLGYVYWKSGDTSKAGEYMEHGKTVMGERLGAEHPTYLGALRIYARYLRSSSRVEDAEVVERQVRQSEAVVNVQSLQNGAVGLAGLR